MLVSFRVNRLATATILLVISTLLLGCSTPNGSPADGKRWYSMHNCFACHGENGNDGKAPVIRDTTLSFHSFLSTVRNANSPIMPKFPEEKLPKQDVADIYAWLTTKQ